MRLQMHQILSTTEGNMMGSIHKLPYSLKKYIKIFREFGDCCREHSQYTPLAKDWSIFIREGHLLQLTMQLKEEYTQSQEGEGCPTQIAKSAKLDLDQQATLQWQDPYGAVPGDEKDRKRKIEIGVDRSCPSFTLSQASLLRITASYVLCIYRARGMARVSRELSQVMLAQKAQDASDTVA